MHDDAEDALELDGAVEQLIAMIVGHRVEPSLLQYLEPSSGGAALDPEFCRPYVRESLFYRSLHFSADEVQSRMLKREPDKLALDYTRTMMGFLLFNAKPQRIAMIGLGGGSLAKFCYRHLPDTQIDVVEVNPYVLALREEFQVPPDNDRFRVHLADGARFIADASNRYDVLLVDGYTRFGVPQALSSPTFFRQCRKALSSDGILVYNLNCADSASYIARIRLCFAGAVVTVDETTCSNRIVFACANNSAQPSIVTSGGQMPTQDAALSLLSKRNMPNILAAMRPS